MEFDFFRLNYRRTDLDFLFNTDYGDDKKKAAGKEEKKDEKKDDGGKQQEEKRKHIKSLIEKIPTEKPALFAYELDWSAVDNVSSVLVI